MERGYVHQCTDLQELDEALSEKHPLTCYIGFDCTAPSLHVGSLLPIMLLRWFQKCGHKPIVLLGGGTTKVGDPSGKDKSRQLLSSSQIDTNKKGIQRIFERFLEFGDGATDAMMVDNSEWLDGLHYISFLRDYGRHFSINRMLGFDSVKLRLEREQTLSFLEFNYMILQAYDFLELNRRYNCSLQMGGSDQWGNIVNGVELARRVENIHLFGLTSPLITTSTGLKMGKSAEGAVWLNADHLSPYDYWQFWRNSADQDVGRFLRLFTELPLEEINRLESLKDAEINEAKKILANIATQLCHGENAAKDAEKTASETFEKGRGAYGLPTHRVPADEIRAGMLAVELFSMVGLTSSKSEARRLIRAGGARINNKKINDEKLFVSIEDADDEGLIKLSVGKKKHNLVKIH